ncbi:BrnT family toxin, partial [bacterium]|nr:BrnT family toxin [bacterium]
MILYTCIDNVHILSILEDSRVKIRGFSWTRWTVQHISRHHVKPDEVEECFLERLEMRVHGSRRRTLIGKTLQGRYLLVVFSLKESGLIDVVTARDLSPRE